MALLWTDPFSRCLVRRAGQAASHILLIGIVLATLQPALGQDDPPAKPQAKATPRKKPTTDDEAPAAKKAPADSSDDEPAAPPALTLRERANQLQTSRSPILRLASVPNMFGDYFNLAGQVQIGGAVADIPTAGMLGRTKVADNNKAVTMDRVYFMYNHYHNALQGDVNRFDAQPAQDLSVDRYTLGLEKRFLDDLWSVDLRLPFISRYDFGVQSFGVTGDEVGNLAITLKRQLVATCTTGVVTGLAIETPTGGDIYGNATSTRFLLNNDAVHLSPYLGWMCAPYQDSFYHGFLQVDVPLNGNRLEFADPNLNRFGRFGKLSEQTLLHVDVGAGHWLYRNRCAPLVTGVAGVVELHYTSTLNDADLPGRPAGIPVGILNYQFGNQLNRIDIIQLTVGLHTRLGCHTTLRVGGAFPLNRSAQRPFDSEVLVSLNRYF